MSVTANRMDTIDVLCGCLDTHTGCLACVEQSSKALILSICELLGLDVRR